MRALLVALLCEYSPLPGPPEVIMTLFTHSSQEASCKVVELVEAVSRKAVCPCSKAAMSTTVRRIQG